MEKHKDLSNLCRLCLKESVELEEIFGTNENNSLVLRIMASVSLEVHRGDNLPKCICPSCRYQLEKTYIFRSKCRDNDTRLRRHVKLIGAGKASSMLDEFEDDEDEFGQSLDYIRGVDTANELDKQKVWEAKVLALEDEFRSMKYQEKSKMYEHLKKEFTSKRENLMVDVGTNTSEGENLDLNRTVNEAFEEEASIPETSQSRDVILKEENFVEEVTDGFEEETTPFLNSSHDDAMVDLDETIHVQVAEDEFDEKSVSVSGRTDDDANASMTEEFFLANHADESRVQIDPDPNVPMKEQIRKRIHARLAKHDEELVQYLDGEELMDVEEDEEEGHRSTITVLNEQLQPGCSAASNSELPANSERFLITEVSDSETYVLENELDREEHNLYGSDSDEDLEAVTNAVKAELAEQPGFNIGENCVMKVEKDRGLTKVEVRANDGSVICMEFSTEPKKKPPLSMAALRAKMAGVFPCKQCPLSFKTSKQLQSHVNLNHSNAKGHACNVCEKWCPTKSSLERHYRTHTGEKPFICGECGKSFVQKEILKRHMLIHTDEKPYKCPHCPARYNQKDQLRHHVNMRHTVNPVVTVHKCNICEKDFRYASGLSRHMATHYGRTFSCDCGKVFSDKSALKRHEVGIHGKGNKDKEATK